MHASALFGQHRYGGDTSTTATGITAEDADESNKVSLKAIVRLFEQLPNRIDRSTTRTTTTHNRPIESNRLIPRCHSKAAGDRSTE